MRMNMPRHFARIGILLLLVVPVAAEVAPHIAQARQFLKEFRAQDHGTMALFAAQPMRKTQYALVLFSLLESREWEAARKLVDLRAGAPDGPGLQRLQKGYESGVRATPDERSGWVESERLLRARRPADALGVLEKVGRPSEGTIIGVRNTYNRGLALAALERWEPALAALSRASVLATNVGWLARALQADTLRLRLAQQQQGMDNEVALAAGRIAKLARAMDERETEMSALLARATLYTRHGKATAARKDYATALARARSLNKPLVEARILTNLGSLALLLERQPKRARRDYEDALLIFEREGAADHVRGVRLNLSRALTNLADYDAGIVQLDTLDKDLSSLEDPGPLARASRSQRAYIRRRQGRLERSLELYGELAASATTPVEKQALALDMGDLQLVRGNFHAALAQFNTAKDEKRIRARAFAGAAAAWGGLQNEQRCRELFAEALEAATGVESKGRVGLQWSAYERRFGNIERALELVNAARARLATEEGKDFGNAAAAWAVTADLLLLDEQREAALRPLASASVFFARLQDPSRAVPAYGRETLILLGFDDRPKHLDDIIKRHGTMLVISEGTSNPGLKGLAASVDAHYLHQRGNAKDGNERFDEALKYAREANSPAQEATALAGKALYAGAAGLALAEQAILALDRRPDDAPAVYPFVAGERGDYAPSIALRAMLEGEKPDATRAYELVERIKQTRVQLALRGRDAILVRTLSAADYAGYVAVRGRLREARAAGTGEEQARSAFETEMNRLRMISPLAFTHVPSLAAVQKALGPTEALLLFVDDPYVKIRVAITREGIRVGQFLDEDRLSGLQRDLRGKTHIVVAPDGFASIDGQKWEKATLADAFSIRYCATAASFVAQRAPRQRGARPTLREHKGRVRLDLLHPQASNVDLATAETARLLIISDTVLQSQQRGTPDGIACVAEARIRAGADAVLMALGPVDARLIARFREHYAKNGDADAALRAARKWARKQADLREARHWATLVLWGTR